jgi:hypothetical protein
MAVTARGVTVPVEEPARVAVLEQVQVAVLAEVEPVAVRVEAQEAEQPSLIVQVITLSAMPAAS